MAALCHDLGHLPFSHAAEHELLPKGWTHERLTLGFIRSDELQSIWDDLKLNVEDIAKLAVGQKDYRDSRNRRVPLSDWEAILSEMIVGDAFGADRMDYLLRDSVHTGVAYGKFGHYRLLDTLRVLPREQKGSKAPYLGVEEGGIHCAEALLLARYFMFTQLYYHHIRRIYDIHLMDFLKKWLPDGRIPVTIDRLLKLTDNEVMAGILNADNNKRSPSHEEARRIVRREHFRLLYERTPADLKRNPEGVRNVARAARKRFGSQNVRHDAQAGKGSLPDFPVLTFGGHIESSLMLSEALNHIPVASFERVFIAPELRDKAQLWLNANRKKIFSSTKKKGR